MREIPNRNRRNYDDSNRRRQEYHTPHRNDPRYGTFKQQQERYYAPMHYDERNVPREKKRERTPVQYVCMAIGAVLVALFVIKSIQIAIIGIQPAIQTFQILAEEVFNRFIESCFAAGVLYLIVMAIGGGYIPIQIRRKILPITIALALLYSVAPALSTAIGELLIVLAGIFIMLSAIRS